MRGDPNYPPSSNLIFSHNPYWTTGVKWLIIANAVMFGVQIVCWKILDFPVEPYLALSPQQVIYHGWLWQLITAAFLHDVFMPTHILFNMLILFCFGFLVESHLGTRRFLRFYFAAAVFASLVYTACVLFTTTKSLALGASGAIMSVLVMVACLYPHNILTLIPIRMRTMIWILVGLDLYQALLLPVNSVAVTGHLGGALFGYLYYRFADRIYEHWGRRAVRRERRCNVQTQEDEEHLRHEIDRILDKVTHEGMASLTAQERAFLQKASKQYQGKM
jgi:membrane associated rhomboid family serine protease